MERSLKILFRRMPNMMRKVIVLVMLIGLGQNSYAAHNAGGEITYKYIGDSTGIARHYMIRLKLFRNVAGIILPNSTQIHYTSSCNAGGTITANLISGIPAAGNPIPNTYDCAQSTTPGVTAYNENIYQSNVILPANCGDWVFYWTSCCRSAAIFNLVNPGGQGYIIEAHLNNTVGENSSAVFISPPTRTFCAHSPDTVNFYQFAVDADGDSLNFYLAQPLTGNYPGTAVAWAPGYAVNSPFTTVNGLHLNHANGVMTFKPVQPEICSFKINIDEFRFDLVALTWVKVGTVTREIDVRFVSTCNSNAQNWQTVSDTSLSSNANKTVYAQCGDKELKIYTTVPFACQTLAADGSDFLIYKKDGTLLPIVAANSNCNPVYSSEITLVLNDTLSANDTLSIVSHTGSDFNTLANYCGFELPQGDSLKLIVSGCSGIGLSEEKEIIKGIYPNPSHAFIDISFHDNALKTIELLSPDGKLIHRMEIRDNRYRLDLSKQAIGVYFLTVDQNAIKQTRKVIKR